MGIAFQTLTAGDNRLHVLQTSKFKTNTLVLNIAAPLREESVTSGALCGAVLMRGSRLHPTIQALQEALDDLYGASLDLSMYKLGDRHITRLELEVPNQKYLSHAPDLLERGVALMAEVLLDPLTEGDGFRRSHVELEKEVLRKRIEGIFNNKGRYATLRCLDSLCEGDPYRLFSYGRLEDLAGIDPAGLYHHYRHWLATSPMDFYLVGDVEATRGAELIARAFAITDRHPEPVPATRVLEGHRSPREVVERFEVNQGQLVMGYRVPILFESPDYPRMTVFNAVLGGYAHSKLFVNVREKASLAYSAYSRYDSHKGLLFIQAGINIENYEQAVSIILEQIDAIARGEVSEVELAQTKAMLANDYREMADSPAQLAHYAFTQDTEDARRPVEELLAEFNRVSVEDLREMARGLSLDTRYFLRDKESVEAAHA